MLEIFEEQIQPLLASVRKGIPRKSEPICIRVLGILFSSAQVALHKLELMHRAAVASFMDRQSKVAACGSAEIPQPEEKMQGLRDWLDRLEQKRREGMMEPLKVGLRNGGALRPRSASRPSKRPMMPTSSLLKSAMSCGDAWNRSRPKLAHMVWPKSRD